MDSKKKLKVLCLSLRTPPEPRPQAILIGKMISEWIRQGVYPVVVTYVKDKKWGIKAPVYEIKPLKTSRFPVIREFIQSKNAKNHCQQIAKLIKENKINLIFSFSNPQYSNVLGAMLKQTTGVKFISHFSDPWYDDPYHSLSFWSRREILKQEKYIIKNSDRVIFVSERLKQLVMAKYPIGWLSKTAVVPHCYQESDYPPITKTKTDKFVFSYLGVFYKQRTPEMFFKAIKLMLIEDPEPRNRILIKIIGGADNYSKYQKNNLLKLVNKYSLNEVVELLPAVSYQESLRQMKLADCLLVIDADIKDSPFLPSKAVDYAGSGTPIIGITPAGSPTADFLRQLGYRTFNYSEAGPLTKYLGVLIKREVAFNVNQEFLQRFAVDATTAKLINYFKETLDGKK